MLKKLPIILISIFLLTLNANAGSDGDLKLEKEPKKVKDCFETLNRATFAFNMGLDKAFFKPVSKGYRKLPSPIRKGTSNALNNLSNLVTVPNNILQGDFRSAANNSVRFVINTTIGIVGIFDPANALGFEKGEKEDFGQSLGVMGVGEGCYLVLPVLGPSTVRDTVGSLVSLNGGDAWYNITVEKDTNYVKESDYYVSKGLSAVDFRAKNLEAFDSIEKNSIDLYASFKSLYLQNMENKINNSSASEDDWLSLIHI